MSDKKFNIDLVSLDSINVLSDALDNPGGLKTIDHSVLDILFQYQLIPLVSIKAKKVRVIADYEIRAAINDESEVVITSKCNVAFIFSVTNLTDLADVEDGKLIELDEEMLSSLLNITYSTSRGILYTRYLGTALDGLILPVIPTADLLKPSAIKPIRTKK